MTMSKHQHLPSFSKVLEVYENDIEEFGGPRSVALIVPAVSDGRRRYHVYRLDLARGDLLMIGCELPLTMSRAIARRSRVRDWEPLTEEESRIGRRPRWEKWKWRVPHDPSYKGPRKKGR